MTNRYRAGQPADLSPMLVNFAGEEPPEETMNSLLEADYNQFHREPVKPAETPLSAVLMDAAADSLDWVLDRLWVAAVVIVSVVAALVWSLR